MCATRVQIPDGFIQEVLARADIVDIVSPYVQLKKGGANLLGLCPFHGEKSPSFTVSPAKQFYHCFGCGAHGDALRFLMEHSGLGFLDAVRDLASRVGLKVPEVSLSAEEQARADAQHSQRRSITELQERAAEHYQERLKASPRAIEYLKKRGLSGTIARDFGLGYAPDGWRNLASAFADYADPVLVDAGLVITHGDEAAEQKRYDRFRDRIMFPIRSTKGEVIGFGGRIIDAGEPKYLNSPETPVFVKGRELYGLFEGRSGIRERGYALVVEGYMDVVALAQMDFDNAVATLGTACTEEHVRKLFRFTDSVVFSFDGDAAGRRAATRALEAALPHASDLRTVRFLFLPPEHDPDSFVRAEGSAAFERAVAQAVPLSRQLVDVARDGCDLGIPEGRARFLSQARPLWATLPDGGFRRQMLAELARTANLPEAELAAQWATAGAPAQRERPAPAAAAGPSPARRTGGFAASRRAPRRPEDRIVHLLLTQPSWWDSLTVEDHDLLHALPAPHGELVAWLERDIVEHGPRPWAAVRTALADDASLGQALASVGFDESDDMGAGLADLRLLLDGKLLQALEARQTALAPAAAADPQARADYQATSERVRQLRARIDTTRRERTAP